MPFYEAMPHGPKANMSGKSLVELTGAVAQVFGCVDMDGRLCWTYRHLRECAPHKANGSVSYPNL